MNLERLVLTYTVESLRKGTGESVPAVWLSVERFTRAGAAGLAAKQSVGLVTELTAAANEARKRFQAALDHVGDRHPMESGMLEIHLREVVIPAARALTELLIPVELGAEIQGAGRVLSIEFRVDPVLIHVPWELLFLGKDFLSFAHATGCHVVSRGSPAGRFRSSAGGPLRSAFLVDPCPIGEEGLEETLVLAATGVLQRWEQLPESKGIHFSREGTRICEPVSGGRLTRILQSHDLVVVMGHHADRSRAPKASPEREGLVLADEDGTRPELFPPAALLDALRAPNAPPELLFWLACESGLATGWGEDWPDGKRIHGFVDAAVRTGVTHFIGSSILIPQTVAADLVEPFLLALETGCSVGEALRRARVAARLGRTDPACGGSLVGLGFSLFGRPSLGLLNAAGKRIGGAQAHPCQHVEGGEPCHRLYLPGEPGSENERCAAHVPGPKRAALRQEPCGNPYGKHVDVVVLVSEEEHGWPGGIQASPEAVPRFMRLCKLCRGEAIVRKELIRLEDLAP